jgi:hypothetical protein
MIVKQLMYKNKVDKVFDNVFVTFFKSTNKQNVFNCSTHSTYLNTQASHIYLKSHVNTLFLQCLYIQLSRYISILMSQINSHAKKWRFTS